MKIAIWHNLPSGGGKRALYYHVRGLLEYGHTIEAWCPATANQQYLPLSALVTEHVVPLTSKTYTAKTSFGSALANFRSLKSKLQAMEQLCTRCAGEIQQYGADVVFANSCELFRVPPLAKYVTLPRILYLQEPYRWLYEALPTFPWLAYPAPRHFWWSPRYLKLIIPDWLRIQMLRVQAREEYQNVKRFDTLLVNSLFSRESVLRAYGLDAKVCYLGIDTELFRPLGLPKEPFVVGLGGIYEGKRIDRAIRALATIEEKTRPPLIWIGNFSSMDYQRDMEALAAALNVRLVFEIHVADQKIVDTLNRASAMIYTPQLEPFGFAPLEANACGTPVVAIAEGGIRESVQHGLNGFLVPHDDPHALGEALAKLLEQPTLITEMGKRAREYVIANWSWEKATQCLEAHLLNGYHH